LVQNKKFFKASQNHKSFLRIIIGQVNKVNRINWDLTLWDGTLKSFSMMAGMTFIIIIFMFHSLLNVNISNLILILLVFNRLAPQFNKLAGHYTRISERIPIHESVTQRIRELKTNEEITGTEEYLSGCLIHFDNVSFGYTKDMMVLKNIDIQIHPYHATAIVGGSGAGKSTLLDLFLGLLKPDEGVVYYGKIAHDALNIHFLRDKVAYVSQETTLIDGSLLYNLTISNPEASEEDVREICEKAMLTEIIDKLPQGLHTEIGENGINLSGGQRQRLSLGRALLNKPEILILDEATSQLDSESEAFIQDAIKGLHNQLTIIIVSHRLSTVRFADSIYVLENGSVCETGTYEELLEQKGRLYQLDSLQHG
jgi:ABC-type multidrug transport system fused ATPase/permease subunit